jgi:MFS transporter, putative metabolite:H+ symporter
MVLTACHLAVQALRVGTKPENSAMPPLSANPARDVAARLDRLPVTPLHWAVLVVCAVGLLFDVVEAGLSNALSAVFSAPPNQVTPSQLSLLLASVFIGGAIGAPLLGLLADRSGRRLALGLALLVLTVTSLLAATSSDIGTLTFYRVLSGIALGSYPALMAAYLADVLPPKRRGRLILLGAAIGFLGAPAVIFLIRWLTPLQPLGFEGWRWALVIGAIGSAATGLLFLCVPESPRWLSVMGRSLEAEAACRRFERSAGLPTPETMATVEAKPDRDSTPQARDEADRFWSSAARPIRWRALLFGTLDFLSPWATIGFPLLSGAVLVEKGFRVSDSLLYVGVAMFGPSIGVLLGALLIDRIDRRIALALCGGSMALLGLTFAVSATALPLMASGVAFQLIGAIYIVVINVYASEAFPTRLRASIVSTTWAVNRVAAALVPLALLPVLKSAGPLAMFSIVAAALVASVTLLLAFGPRGLVGRPVK